MMTGCYPLEALLQSTLQCFYDQQCIDPYGNYKALNSSSVSSRFDVNTTIEFILRELMVEKYTTSMSYEKYFDECAPSVCNYSYSRRLKIIDIVEFLMELYGGLIIIAQWIIEPIMKLYRHRIHRRINTQIQ